MISSGLRLGLMSAGSGSTAAAGRAGRWRGRFHPLRQDRQGDGRERAPVRAAVGSGGGGRARDDEGGDCGPSDDEKGAAESRDATIGSYLAATQTCSAGKRIGERSGARPVRGDRSDRIVARRRACACRLPVKASTREFPAWSPRDDRAVISADAGGDGQRSRSGRCAISSAASLSSDDPTGRGTSAASASVSTHCIPQFLARRHQAQFVRLARRSLDDEAAARSPLHALQIRIAMRPPCCGRA